MIELPEFVNGRLIERTYQRAIHWQNRVAALSEKERFNANRWRTAGLNRAVARDPKLLLFLEKGADYLQKLNDAQQARLEYHESGNSYARQEFTEFATWREAYLKASEPERDEQVLYKVFGWIYAAVAEALAQ